jgi:hypothetical protein
VWWQGAGHLYLKVVSTRPTLLRARDYRARWAQVEWLAARLHEPATAPSRGAGRGRLRRQAEVYASLAGLPEGTAVWLRRKTGTF